MKFLITCSMEEKELVSSVGTIWSRAKIKPAQSNTCHQALIINAPTMFLRGEMHGIFIFRIVKSVSTQDMSTWISKVRQPFVAELESQKYAE